VASHGVFSLSVDLIAASGGVLDPKLRNKKTTVNKPSL